jgi:ADP-ribose pyrophosphatase YjhB (NUDIX family)
MEKNPVLSIDLIIEDSMEQILLGRVSEKWQEGGRYLWGLPGRELLFGESLRACTERNLYEELGMEMLSSKVVCVNSNFGYSNHYITIGILVRARGDPVNKRPIDWIEWRWFKADTIPLELFPSARQTLKAFFQKVVSLDFE